MKTYLTQFFEICEYDTADAQYFLELYDKIVSNSKANDCLNRAIGLYTDDMNCDYDIILKYADDIAQILGLREYTTHLMVYICLTKQLLQNYKEREIDVQIFYKTVCNLRYKLQECKQVKGVRGTFSGGWLSGFFNMKRFALGRLEFEVAELEFDYNKNGIMLPKGTKVINTHIPQTGEPIDKQSCDDSFRRAKEFFKNEIGNICAFICVSWILYPENINIFEKHTNMYRFHTEFDALNTITFKDHPELWRLFGTEEKNPDRLPADTSVRRNFIKYIKNGGKTGSTYGIKIFD